ncbi:MAG: EVE domain-containing protein [Bacteriovoracaceae bacterium]
MAYWLFKTEPDVFSIDDLKNRPKQVEHWDGVRNYQARNFMRDEIKLGDLVLIYHSNAKPLGVAGVAEVVKEAYPDHTQFDKSSQYYDPKSTEEKPRWYMVDVKFVEKFKNFISLENLKSHKELNDLIILRKGNRLSITPVEKKHFNYIKKIGRKSV